MLNSINLISTKYCFNGKLLYVRKLKMHTTIACSSSSLTSTQVVKDDLSMLMKSSLDSTSSFLTSSPCTLVVPAMPYLPQHKARFHFQSAHKRRVPCRSPPVLALWSGGNRNGGEIVIVLPSQLPQRSAQLRHCRAIGSTVL